MFWYGNKYVANEKRDELIKKLGLQNVNQEGSLIVVGPVIKHIMSWVFVVDVKIKKFAMEI